MRRLLLLLCFTALLALGGCGSNNPIVIVETSKGPIKIELFDSDAPLTVKNFLKYVDDKHYDGTIFHRVSKNPSVIQGGGYSEDFKERLTGDPIKNESYNGQSNKRGTIAMARTQASDSATSQFYINTKDNTFLDRKDGVGSEGYCVFGKVIEGMDVVDAISRVQTAKGDIPMDIIVIKSVRRVDNK